MESHELKDAILKAFPEPSPLGEALCALVDQVDNLQGRIEGLEGRDPGDE